ncbi:hypothetical protein ASPZODRAFT_26897 [Penicilliopsis zonata CBS 506.65]|uniref:Uncharacterized protein n=1 Tax=Penicilliopsis zonata CBS 506.65 TaxID=1073090 RepID=A0A1L9SCI2_9EURO|nr:hypothetical protein ASPZODRAFT_26897 [Penicilliopsis zonata CBS 506.65]OJJ44853.1 hypothetical protein ASPZODRAFT_26897 [Penicilliopsis zonata CBS 506.65]
MQRELFPPMPTQWNENHGVMIMEDDIFLNAWIDPDVINISKDISAKVYLQTTRGTGFQGSYLLRLPPGYEAGEESYPVLYWLHSGLQTSRSCHWALQFHGQKIEEGLMPKCIIVAPPGTETKAGVFSISNLTLRGKGGVQVLPQGRYIDNYDGTRPLATIIKNDLVNAIITRFRTIRHKSARWFEGSSMEGWITEPSIVALNNPDILCAASAIAPAVLWKMEDEAGDMPTRIPSGEKGFRLVEAMPRMINRMRDLKYNFQTKEAPGVGHYYQRILAEVEDSVWAWWMDEVAPQVVKPEVL